MKKMMVLALALILSLALSVPAAASLAFTDIAPNAYYAEAVAWAVEQGITSGTTSTTFSPDQTCTRAEIATLIWRSQGCPEPVNNPDPSYHDWTFYIPDVPDGAYYSGAARWMSLALDRYLLYDKQTAFRPNDPCTRLEAVEFLYAVYGRDAVKSDFSDVEGSEAVDWAASWGITSGTSETAFSPDAVCTRGQIVTFLHRASLQPAIDITSIDGTYVLESNPEYELKVQYAVPRLHIEVRNRKYDAHTMTANMYASYNSAYTDDLILIVYPDYLILENNPPFSFSGKYVLDPET